MKFFITGGSGFLGKHLSKLLREAGYSVTAPSSKQADLTEATSLKSYSTENYDVIVHLAAWTQAGDFCLKHPGDQWLINQKINTTVLDWWFSKQSQAKIVVIGTSCAYASGSQLKEENFLTDIPDPSLFTYAMTKKMLIQGVKALAEQYGLRYLCGIPSTLYGNHYDVNGKQLHFIFDLMKKIIRGKELGEDVILWGTGDQKREIVLVDDFCRLLIQLIESNATGLFNIGADHNLTIKEFAQLICEIVDYPFTEIEFDTTAYTGALEKNLCNDRLRAEIGELDMTPLRDGISETINWFYSDMRHWR